MPIVLRIPSNGVMYEINFSQVVYVTVFKHSRHTGIPYGDGFAGEQQNGQVLMYLITGQFLLFDITYEQWVARNDAAQAEMERQQREAQLGSGLLIPR